MARLHSNNWLNREGTLDEAAWPMARLGEAMHALARHAGLASTCHENFAPLPDLNITELAEWMDAAADRGGIEARQVVAGLDELPALAREAAPLLMRLPGPEGDRYLAILGARGRDITLLGPDDRRHRCSLGAFVAYLRRPYEQPVEGELNAVLDAMGIGGRRRARARDAMLTERLKAVRLRSLWLLRLPAGSPIRQEIKETRLVGGVALLIGAHLVQYVLFVLSWWLLGRGILNGTVDRGWLLGWTLLLLSLIPFRLLATWTQGTVSAIAGASLRRRLLRAALRIDRNAIRQKGAGELFGVVVESAAIESLALSGGVMAGFALVELIVASLVLWSGTGWLPVLLLAGWIVVTGAVAARYVGKRSRWTERRLSMTDQLLESMVGHRTRLAQLSADQWHPKEDLALSSYLQSGSEMDRSSAWLAAFIPRGWLTVSIAALAPAVLSHATPQTIAITLGGVLLAHRSLRRLTGGLSNLAGAAIAGRAIAPLLKAAGLREPAPHPSMVAGGNHDASSALAVQARDLTFRYPRQAKPVLQGCSLSLSRGSRLLVEGASGAGKTTLASLLAGLETAESGLLLVDGLDRSVLGKAGWRRRIAMAPQAHDNYLVGGTLAFNLLLGRHGTPQQADLVEAEQVCRELGLGELLDRLPSGLHQMVGETGWQLSQGERTRVFLARALLQKPDVLVLDESFSALDPENVDRSIRAVLRRAPTVVAIAHA